MVRSIQMPVCLALAGSLWLDCAASSAQEIRDALNVAVLEPGQTLKETQEFVRARIAPMPQAETAERWMTTAANIRNAVLDKVVFRGEAARWRDRPGKVIVLQTIDGTEGYSIRKLRLEVLPELWVPALLYVPSQLQGKVPVFLNVNGHDGAGKAADYKQARCIHMARNGIIALNLEWFGMGQLATPGFGHGRMNQLDLCGTSGLAPFFLAMSRSIDFLLTLEHADSARVGVAGLSGGGWQTILISSLDPRVTLCNPVAGYSSFLTRIDNHSDLGDSEQTPVDLGVTADYATLTAMLAPRAALLTYNDKDSCCFATAHALPPLLKAAEPIYSLTGSGNRLRSHRNSDPGTHNFLIDNRQALYRMIRDQWFDGDESRFSTLEQPLDSEIRTREELSVELPADNRDFQSVAKALMSVQQHDEMPQDPQEWRQQLQSIVRPVTGELTEESVQTQDGPTRIVHHRFRLGSDWTIPAIEFSRADSMDTVILLSDHGKASAAEHVEPLLNGGARVIVVDLFYFGESAIQERGYLWALLVSTAGERPLGIQSGQLGAIARWFSQREAMPVSLQSHGPRSGLIALTCSALFSDSVYKVTEVDAFASLRDVVEQNWSVEQAPELFCFGLMGVTDLPQLRKMASQSR